MANYYGQQRQAYGLGQSLQGIFPAPIVTAGVAPTINDHAETGQMWVLTSGTPATDVVYVLSGIYAGQANWKSLSGGTGSGAITPTSISCSGAVTFQTIINGVLVTNGTGVVSALNDTAPASAGKVLLSNPGVTPVFGAIASSDGTITVTATATGIDLKVVGGGVDWSENILATKQMAVNEGYIANFTGARLVYTLPVLAAIGQVVRVIGKNADLYDITQNAGQQIVSTVGNTTAGVGHGIRNAGQYDIVELRCITANTTWVAYSTTGTFIIY